MFSKLLTPLNKSFRKMVAVVCISTFTIVNVTPIVLATSLFNKDANMIEVVQTLKPDNTLQKNQKEFMSKKILGKKQEVSKDFLYIKDLSDIKVISGINGQPQNDILKGQSAAQGLPSYSLSQLRSMSYADMMNAIAGTSWENISDLFKNSAESKAFFNDTPRFKYMMTDLATRGARFNSTNDEGIPTIVEVIRSGFYLGYYNPSDYPGLWTSAMAKLCLPALRNIINNPYCNYGTAVQDSVIDAFGSLIGNSTCDLALANQATRLLRDFRYNSTEYLKSVSKSGAVFKVMSGIGYVFYTEGYDYWGQDPKLMPSFGKIDGFIDELIQISNIQNLGTDDQWLVNNGLYYVGQLAKFYSNPVYILSILTQKMDAAVRYSPEFFSAASQIAENYDGINSRGEQINYEQLQKEGNKYWLPKHYTFDDGAIQIDAGDKVSPEKIQRMYWATKEVESQFFRVYGNDKALEPDNPDKVLTIKLFNSPAEYTMNSYINGISTDNGGMYIEPYGTFYTYERTTQESVYSLEELFRHEFTHYLQSKFQTPGMWGEGDFYVNSDLEWFDEGTAEFFAGSTRTEGVQPRRAIVNYLSDKPSERYTLNTLFKSGYSSGWDFYNYGWAYISYIYKNDIATLMGINDSIMNYKIGTFKTILQNQANSSSTEAAYQGFMTSVKADNSIGTPLVSDAYVKTHPKRNLATIKSDIMSLTGINNFTQGQTASPTFSTFKLEGIYTGTASQGKTEDWKKMNTKANDILKSLSNRGWTGYDTVTCYFTNYKVVNGVYQFNIVFRGLLNDGNVIVVPENQAPIAVINAKSTAKVSEIVEFKGNESRDTDGSIVAYAWNFGDGSTSNLVNPTHKFNSTGTFTVNLKVTDDKGAIGQIEFTVVITKDEVVVPNGALTFEIGDNDSAAQADKNGFIGNNIELSGSISDYNDADYYSFEVAKAGEVNIKVTCANPNVTWVVYKSTNLNSYVTWAQPSTGNTSIATFSATVGKYYISLYPYANIKNQSYKVLINGIKSYETGTTPPVEDDVIYEEEPNDFGNVPTVRIRNNVKTVGTLTNSDSDLFYFDVATSGKVNISVKGIGDNYTWVIYREDNQGNYVCWAQDIGVDGLNGSFQAETGRYHIMVYNYNNSSVNYTININGIK